MPENKNDKNDKEIIEKTIEEDVEDVVEAVVPEKKKGGLLKIIIVIAVIVAVVLVAHFTGITEYLQLENVHQVQEWIGSFGIIGYLIFILLYIAVAVFMLPAFFFTILAGAAFGPILGGILALLGATIGASIAFVVARYVARDTMVSRFGGSPLFKKIDKGLEENGVSFLILTRLVPVFPYNVQNYIYGLTPIKLGTFSLVSLICMAPGAFIYAFMAGIIIEEGITPMLMLYFAGAGLILFLVSLIPKYIAKKKGIKLNDDK